MLTAKDLMDRDAVFVDPDDTVGEVVATMLRTGRDGLPVVNMPGQLLGFVTEYDLWGLLDDPDVADHAVYHYMTREVHRVDENAPLNEVAEAFGALPVRQLPVVQGDRVVGVIGRHDVFRRVLEEVGPLKLRLHLAPHPVPTPRARSRSAAARRRERAPARE